MNVPLWEQIITVRNDGYIGFELVTGNQTFIRKQMASVPPIVSLEVLVLYLDWLINTNVNAKVTRYITPILVKDAVRPKLLPKCLDN